MSGPAHILATFSEDRWCIVCTPRAEYATLKTDYKEKSFYLPILTPVSSQKYHAEQAGKRGIKFPGR
jgi:hypothetical protein